MSPSRATWLVLCGALTACGSPEAAREVEPSPVRRAALEPAPARPTKTCEWIAVVVAEHRVDVAAPIAARVWTLPAAVGETVPHGQPIAELRDPAIPLAIEAADATLRTAEAELARIEVDARQARRAHAQARALGELASADELAAAEAAVQQIEAAHAGARAEVDRLAAERTRLRERQRELTVRAAFDGTVALLHHAPGAWVEAGAPLVRLVSHTTLVRIAVPVEEVAAVTLGTRIAFAAEASEAAVAASVLRIAPEVDDAGYVLVEARPLAEAPKPGTPGRVRHVCG